MMTMFVMKGCVRCLCANLPRLLLFFSTWLFRKESFMKKEKKIKKWSNWHAWMILKGYKGALWLPRRDMHEVPIGKMYWDSKPWVPRASMKKSTWHQRSRQRWRRKAGLVVTNSILYSVDFSKSRISGKMCIFDKRTIKVCVRWYQQCPGGKCE